MCPQLFGVLESVCWVCQKLRLLLKYCHTFLGNGQFIEATG